MKIIKYITKSIKEEPIEVGATLGIGGFVLGLMCGIFIPMTFYIQAILK